MSMACFIWQEWLYTRAITTNAKCSRSMSVAQSRSWRQQQLASMLLSNSISINIDRW
jgi:hypothetical protein